MDCSGKIRTGEKPEMCFSAELEHNTPVRQGGTGRVYI